MGLFSLSLGGGAFILIGAWEAISLSYAHLRQTSPPPTSRTRRRTTTTTPNPFSSLTLISIFFLSFLCIIDSTISSIDAFHRNDRIGIALQWQSMAISSLFLLYAIIGLLIDFTHLLPLPPSIPTLIALFAFGEEFLLFYLQRKDPDGLENRYFGLLLIPISVCFFSTIMELGFTRSPFPRFCRGVGLILQGTWFVQMGFSFYTDLIANGCVLIEKSRGNYTIRCKRHEDGHRSRAIAMLQFNFHLAFLVVVIVGLYSIIGQNHGSAVNSLNYKPIGEEMRGVGDHSHFTLDSDDDDDGGGGEITAEEESGAKQKPVVMMSGMNGFGAP